MSLSTNLRAVAQGAPGLSPSVIKRVHELARDAQRLEQAHDDRTRERDEARTALHMLRPRLGEVAIALNNVADDIRELAAQMRRHVKLAGPAVSLIMRLDDIAKCVELLEKRVAELEGDDL